MHPYWKNKYHAQTFERISQIYGQAPANGTCLCKCYLSSLADTLLSSVTLYIIEGSRETFSMNIGDVVMFWICASRNTSSVCRVKGQTHQISPAAEIQSFIQPWKDFMQYWTVCPVHLYFIQRFLERYFIWRAPHKDLMHMINYIYH